MMIMIIIVMTANRKMQRASKKEANRHSSLASVARPRKLRILIDDY